MPYSDHQVQLGAQKEHYENNKDVYKNRQRYRRKVIREYIDTIKESLKCSRCPESRSVCLHFHHRDPSTKIFGIGDAAMHKYSLNKIKEEMAKCDVLCANCHLVEHQ